MRGIKVTPIAYESYGVRASCLLVETPDVVVLVDAGLALAPRFGLMPHPREYEARVDCRGRIKNAAERADVITVSHYHHDHYTPDYWDTVWLGSTPELAEQTYSSKIVLVKDWRSNINPSQRRRGWLFQRWAKPRAKRLEVADGCTFGFGDTELRFSTPVFHGEDNTELGWVVMLTIERGENRFLHASDVQGPMSDMTRDLILHEHPDLLAIGGQPLYLAGTKVQQSAIDRARDNLRMIVRNVPATILDHHLLRAEDWRNSLTDVFTSAKLAGSSIMTAAEYAGRANALLESGRRALYESDLPSEEFMRWSRMAKEKRREIWPPL